MCKVLITGGSGLLGGHLTDLLTQEGYDVWHLTRNLKKSFYPKTYYWNVDTNKIEPNAFINTEYIIHLAGAGIVDKKWTPKYKQLIFDSRVKSQELLLNEYLKSRAQLKAYFSASGINYYGADTGEKINRETDSAGSEFISDVVSQWEKAAHEFAKYTRVACFRFGIILDKDKGALPKLSLPSRFLAAAAFGKGTQYVPWIHVKDAARVFLHAINQKLQGVFNAVASEQITNAQLIKAIDSRFYNFMFLPKVPAGILKLFLGDRSQLLLGSVKADNTKLLQTGFVLQFNSIESALNDIFKPIT